MRLTAVQISPQKNLLWKKILDSSAAMENMAQKNDWTGLAGLIDQRQLLLNEFFDDTIASLHRQELDKIRLDIERIQDRDVELLNKSKGNRDHIAESLAKITKGKRMNKSYQSLN